MPSDHQDTMKILAIDSPLHQLKAVEEVVLDTGAAVLIPVGVEEFAKEMVGKSQEEIVELLEGMRMLPEIMMGERVEGGLPVLALFALIDQPVADMLDPVAKDEKEKTEDE